MNCVQEFVIKKEAKNKANSLKGCSDYYKQMAVNELLVQKAGVTYDNVSLFRKLCEIPDVEKRELNKSKAALNILSLGSIGATGGIIASALTQNTDLQSVAMMSMLGYLSGVAIGELGVKLYKENIAKRLSTEMERFVIRKKLSKSKKTEKKLDIYVKTLEEELEKI